MLLNFSNGWKVKTADSRNIVTEKNGVVDGYFPDLKSALEDLLNQKILFSEKTSIEGVIDLIENAKKEILEKLEENKNGG